MKQKNMYLYTLILIMPVMPVHFTNSEIQLRNVIPVISTNWFRELHYFDTTGRGNRIVTLFNTEFVVEVLTILLPQPAPYAKFERSYTPLLPY